MNEPQPPWVVFPGEASYWGGWKQGPGYAWLMSEFIPFWLAADEARRQAYMQKWPPPDEGWRGWMRGSW